MTWTLLEDWHAQPRGSGVYVIRNMANGKEYVGQALSLRKRIREHFRALSDQQIHRAIRKHGSGCFQVSILHRELDPDRLNSHEVAEIEQRGSAIPKGYNVALGGNGGTCGGWRHTEESRNHMSRIKLASNGMRGRAQTPEARKLIAESNRRRLMSDATREKFRQVQVGRMSTEQAKKIAGRPVLAWFPGSLTPVEFSSVKDAAEWAGITKATMFKWLGGAVRSQMRTKSSDNARAAAAAAWAYVREM